MKKIIALLSLLAFTSVQAQDLTPGTLTIEAFQKLNEKEQRLVMIAARESMAVTLHNAQLHDLDLCVINMPNDEFEVVINTIVGMTDDVITPENDLDASVAVTFVYVVSDLCISLLQQREQLQQQEQHNQQRQEGLIEI